MEHGRRGPDEAQVRGGAHSATARALRAAAACCTTARASGIPASSCRVGRSRCYWRRDGRADLDRRYVDRRAKTRTTASRRTRAREFLRGVASRLERRPARGHAGVRGPVVLHRAGAAGCPRMSIRATNRLDDPMSADAARARLRARARKARRAMCCRCSAGTRRRRATASLGQRAVDHALRQAVLAAGRFAARVSPAAAVAAVHPAARLSAHRAGGSVCSARRAAGPARRARHRSGAALVRRRACVREQRSQPARRQPTGRCAPPSAAEPRDGRLCVFLPPVAELEDYLELIAAVEDASAELGVPHAPRGLRAAARPAAQRAQGDAGSGRDRGEHPAREQLERDARDHATGLYDDARHTRLVNREVHARRPPHRHGRRQSRRARRRDARRTARSCAGPTCCAA